MSQSQKYRLKKHVNRKVFLLKHLELMLQFVFLSGTMKRVQFFAIKNLLALTGFCGVMNLIYLLFYAGLDSDEDRYPSRLLGRQISSIDEDNKYPTTTNYGHLEMMNFDLKEILDRYSLSMNTLGKNYEQAQHTRKRVNRVHTHKKAVSKIVKMSRCASPPFLLIQVHSSPGNFLSREAIRLSWGRPENAINQGSWSQPKRYVNATCFPGRNAQTNMLQEVLRGISQNVSVRMYQ